MADQKSGYSRVWGVLLLLGVGAIAWLTTPISLKYGDEIITSLPTMFGYLLLISLFVERAIEVFLSAWRSGRADELDIEIANLNKQVAR